MYQKITNTLYRTRRTFSVCCLCPCRSTLLGTQRSAYRPKTSTSAIHANLRGENNNNNDKTCGVTMKVYYVSCRVYSTPKQYCTRRTGIVTREKSKRFMQIRGNNKQHVCREERTKAFCTHRQCHFFPATQTYSSVISTILRGNILPFRRITWRNVHIGTGGKTDERSARFSRPSFRFGVKTQVSHFSLSKATTEVDVTTGITTTAFVFLTSNIPSETTMFLCSFGL